ncbi:ComEC/Rec2 family competence protein [Rhodococcus opacus]|nr:ComEC/Rec2 family competence protein [Rhodococcus opacus]
MPESEPRLLDLRLLPFAGICWAATLIGILGGSRAAWMLLTALSGTAVLLAAGCALRSPGRWTAGTLALLLFGSCCAAGVAWRVQAVERHPMTELARNETWVTLVVTPVDDPREIAGFGRHVLVNADVVEIRRAGETIHAAGAVVLLAPADGWLGLLPGQDVVLRGQLSPPRHRDLSLATVRVSGPPVEAGPTPAHQRWAGAVRTRFAAAAAVLPAAEAGLLPGLVVGDTSALPREVKDDFTATGLTHLTAVSGTNVSILLGAVLLVVRGVGLGPRAGAALAAVALIAFVVVARPSPSVLRAAAMGSVALLALVTGRRKQAMPALAAGVIALLVWAPELAVNFGFVLSATATAGLILIAPVWVDALVGRGWPRAVAETVAVSVAAFAVTAPIVAAMAGTVSLVSICANILVAPVIGVITVTGAVTALIAGISVPVAEVVVRLTQWPLWWLVTVAERGARIPAASVPVPSGPTGAVVVLGAALAIGAALRSRGTRLVLTGIVVGVLMLWAPVWPSALGRLV